MGRFDQDWCDALAADGPALTGSGAIRVLYVVTETDEGKVAFSVTDDGSKVSATAGKLPRGEKADVTITAKEPVLLDIWSGERTRDAAFMAGDIKVEGDYARWLDEIIGTFEAAPWALAWESSVG